MRLRSGTLSDLKLLRHWDTKLHVVAASGDGGWFDWENELARGPYWREILIAEVDGRSVGAMQIIDAAREETRYWGEVEKGLSAIDVWIGEETDLDHGHGIEMMRLALTDVSPIPR